MKDKNEDKIMTDVIFNEDDNDLGFLDWQAPDDHLDPEQYPYLQWNNNTAAWEFPLEHWGGTVIDSDNETVEVIHNFGQDTEPGMLLDCIHIAVVAQREVWEGEDEAGKRFYSATYEKGLRKRYNFLVLIQEAETFDLALITARSYTGGYINSAIKQHRASVLKLASRLAGGTRFPTYMFWLPLVASSEKVWVGSEKKSEIQPPVPVYSDLSQLDQRGQVDLVKSLYIGNDLRDAIQEYLFGQGQAWVAEVQQRRLQPAVDKAQILPGGVLYLPDLSGKRPPAWIECANDIPGLFRNRNHASNAFSKMLREKRMGGAAAAQQWEAWREEIERRFADQQAEQEVVETERLLQNGG